MKAPWAKEDARRPESSDASKLEPPPPKTFSIHGWNFRAQTGRILDSQASEKWSKDLGMTLPEMVFGDSKLEIDNTLTGIHFEFNAFDALAQCKHESDIKVSMAQKWKEKSAVQVPEGHDFDWTYSSTYKGTISIRPTNESRIVGPQPTEDRIDFETLKPRVGDEIIWSAELILYEDELHDNGTSQLQIRIRVTKNYFYVLQRVWVRVDGVIFRLRETRLHHRFTDSHALRLFTEREQDYESVVKSCTAKQLREGILDDPNQINEKLPLKSEFTEKISFIVDSNAKIEKDETTAEEAFKRKFGGVKPNAAALMQRQRQHETRYFDSGDAFTAKSKPSNPASSSCTAAVQGTPAAVAPPAPAQATQQSTEEQARQMEIDRQNSAAEEAFKKKFGGMKPNAAALMQRQRKHETRYFDSGDAFTAKGKGNGAGAAAEEKIAAAPQAVDGHVASPIAAQENEENRQIHENIAKQNAAAEDAFKKKFGGVKPNASALMQRQRQHETRYFDSGDAFTAKAAKATAPAQPSQEKKPEKEPSAEPAAAAMQFSNEEDAEKQEIDRQNAAAEEAFKKKFGGKKPNASALMQRQRQHETRYFDSGDAFTAKAAKATAPGQPSQEKKPEPQQSAEPAGMGQVSSEEDERQKEIDRQNAAAEEAFKKKFGGRKPNASALMQRQRQHETRYFDSGDAFTAKTAKATVQPQPSDETKPEPAPSSQMLVEPAAAKQVNSEGDPRKQEIDRQNAAAEEAFKKKFGGMKPNASALLQRKRQHETRYFDSGDAFAAKTKGEGHKSSGPQEEENPETTPAAQAASAPAASAGAHLSAEEQARAAEIDRQNAEAEEAFKKKFGARKPNAAALMQRQRQHETRYFDSGDAFTAKGKVSASGGAGAGAGDGPLEPLAVVHGQR